MKYLKTITLFIILVFLLFLLSCQDDVSGRINSTDLLAGSTESGKTWSIILIEVELGSINPFECVADNPITYYETGRYEVNEGFTKCDPYDPPSYLGVWRFNKTQTQLTINIGDSTRVWDIIHLDGDIQRISSIFPDGERTYILRTI